MNGSNNKTDLFFSFYTAMQQVLDNLSDLPNSMGAGDLDLIFLRGLMESPIVRSLAKVQLNGVAGHGTVTEQSLQFTHSHYTACFSLILSIMHLSNTFSLQHIHGSSSPFCHSWEVDMYLPVPPHMHTQLMFQQRLLLKMALHIVIMDNF